MERLGSAIPSSAVRLVKRAATECDPEICWAPVLDAAAKGARSREKYVANSGNFSGHVARKIRQEMSSCPLPRKGPRGHPAYPRRLKHSRTSNARPALCKHPNRRTQQTKPSSVTSKNMVRKFSTRAPVASRPAEGSLDANGLDTLYVAREGADAVSTKQVFRVWLGDNPEHTIIVDSKGFVLDRVVRVPPKPVFLLVDDLLPLAVQRLAKAATKHWALLRRLRKAESGDCLAQMISLVLWSAFPEDAERRAGAFWRPGVLAGLAQPSAAASVTTIRGDIVRAFDAQGWDCVYVVLGNGPQPLLAQCFPDGRLGPVRDQVDHGRLAHVPKAEWTEAVTHMVGDFDRLWRERGLEGIPKAMRYIHATRERSVVHPPVPFQPKFQEGDSVVARAFIPPGQGEDGESMDWGWTNGSDGWYPGRVSQGHADGTYSITFEDGDSHDRVPAKFVRVPERSGKRLGGTKRQRERFAADLARSGAARCAEDDEDDGSEVQDGDVLSLMEQPQWYLMVNTRAHTRAYFYDPRDGKTVCGRFQEGSKVIEAEYMKLDGGELLELDTKCEPVNPQHLTGDIEEDRAELFICKSSFLARKCEYHIISRRKRRKT
ncbi:unnamed protein product [Symbiodinium sp. KB8]|nr:unnamed protein product [Symbiodinium sp. KB8]